MAAEPILRGARDDVEAFINETVRDIIANMTDVIRNAEMAGQSEVIHKVPSHWRDSCGIPPEDMRIVIYGKILSHMIAIGEGFDIQLFQEIRADGTEQYYFCIKWTPLITVKDLKKYNDIVSNNITVSDMAVHARDAYDDD
jgi:hypothetical protein